MLLSVRAPSRCYFLSNKRRVILCLHCPLTTSISSGRYFGEPILASDAHLLCAKMCDICKQPEITRARRKAGLVDLDFAQTQAAVAQEAEEGSDVEERDPDDYYPDATIRKKQTGSDEEEAEGDDLEKDSERRPEGFRSAAIERDREIDREAKRREESSSSFDVGFVGSQQSEDEDMEVIGDFMVPLRDDTNNDDEEQIAETAIAQDGVDEVEILTVITSSKKRKSMELIDERIDELPVVSKKGTPIVHSLSLEANLES